jgi:hypothetical protein
MQRIRPRHIGEDSRRSMPRHDLQARPRVGEELQSRKRQHSVAEPARRDAEDARIGVWHRSYPN